ncbi:hypothetical protein PoB_000836800 [Plakobranchus ocellatus]|uniref:Uncharacterized protein n=1 Tax=Plakobranchus ocellatus TaxID=259542 RepID=A0AAV3YI46_9GAST|nr:hypothetical protein PoB_000836800 [Plakobranchus ocellatus]
MFLSPSQVHFTSCIDHLGTSKMAADSHISDVYMEMKMKKRFPRLQVVKKSGHYFTLDNTRLYMFQRMEEEGHCKLVPVDMVMLKKVPKAVQNMMVLPPGVNETKSRPERKRFRLRRASEQAASRSPRKMKDNRDTRSVTCSLETGRRKFPYIKRQLMLEVDDSDCDDVWPGSFPDESASLL